MYLGLFLVPWILIYALSTLSMNHMQFLQDTWGYGPPKFEQVKEINYPGEFSDDVSTKMAALQILRDIDHEGPHYVQGSLKAQPMTIHRQNPMALKRIKFYSEENKIIIEQADFQMPGFLRALHTRHGYQQEYFASDAWAFSVDLFLFAMVFWVLSGLWLWWKMKKTRSMGIVIVLSGIALFSLFLFTI